MRSPVVIVTSKIDPHADAVLAELEGLDQPAVRLNTEHFLNDYAFHMEHGLEVARAGLLSDAFGHSFLVNQRLAAWYRKPDAVQAPASIELPEDRLFASDQGEEVLRTLLALPEWRWINSPAAIRQSSRKLQQLELARSCGFRTPRTLITNRHQIALNFCSSLGYEVVCKSLAQHFVGEAASARFVYTHKVSKQEIESAAGSVSSCPVLLQEHIAKKSEIRATIIGQQVFACELDSQVVDEARIDWRMADDAKVPHREIKLGLDVETRLLNFIKMSGLQFGAIDLIVTPSGEIVFLENNPNGQWYWIELRTGMPMASAMAKLLTSLSSA